MDKKEREAKRVERKANRKPFEETTVGKFLAGTGSTLGSTIGNLLPENGALGVLKNLITSDKGTTDSEKEIALSLAESEFKDVQNARDNETARDTSENSSFLSKNIHEIIALLVIIPWVVSWYVETALDAVTITGAVMLILGYLYGRTKPQS